jgi:hypothetical protein
MPWISKSVTYMPSVLQVYVRYALL